MLIVVLILVMVFIGGLFFIASHHRLRRERFAGDSSSSSSSNNVSAQMLASGTDPYVVRKFAAAVAAFDPYGWAHTPSAPVTVVNPVADGWKKAFNMHIASAAHAMLNNVLGFQQAAFVFGGTNYGGEMYVLPIELMSAPATEFNIESHRELLQTYLKWLAPARIISAVVPEGWTLVFKLENANDVVAKEGMHSSISITAPIQSILIKKM